MPQLGEIRKGEEIGQAHKTGKYIWASCKICKRERWVPTVKETPVYFRCNSCAKLGNKYVSKGGYRTTTQGYRAIYVNKYDFYYPMTMSKNSSGLGGFILEHRLVMAKHLGRNLQSWEIVHHKNHNKLDNEIENLQLSSDLGHKTQTLLEGRIKQLEQENMELKEQLQWVKCY